MGPMDALRVGVNVAGLLRSQWWPAERVHEYQQSKLADMLAFAVAEVPHYRALGLDYQQGDPAEWLQRFPVLSKQQLQASDGAMLADGVCPQQLFQSRTSGSTGEPTVSYFDRPAWLLTKYALKIRRMLNCGVGPGSRVLIVSETSDDKLQADRKAVMPGQGVLFRQDYISLHTPLADHVRRIQALRPHAIYGFPSYFSDLLNYCQRLDVRLPAVGVVFTSSEVMPEALARRLGQFFGARVSDIYGCTEFKELAWQCAAGTYHVNFESALIECVPEHGEGASGSVLLTTLVNRAAPLIRYRVGDLGDLHWKRCACGREGPVLRRLAGREVDMLELPSGQRMSPYLLTTAVEDIPGLSHYQFVQASATQLQLHYVMRDPAAVPDQALLQGRLQALLKGQMQLHLIPVNEIPRTPGGKRKVFVRTT